MCCDSEATSNSAVGPSATLRAVAQDEDALADGEHFGQLVADEDDRDVVRLEAAHDLQQGLDLALGQRGGRLVHGDQARAADERAGDRHHLFVGDAQAFDQNVEVYGDADLFERLFRPSAARRASAPAAASARARN